MSKKGKCSWEYVEGRCRLIFGEERFFSDNGVLNILFDLSDPIQLHEHDVFLEKLKKYELTHNTQFACEHVQDSPILIPDNSNMHFILKKEDMEADALNKCLLPLAYSSIRDGQKRYNGADPVIRHLNRITDTPWVGVIPSEYAKDEIYLPVSQTPNLSDERRVEQERLVVEAFVPRSRFSKPAIDEWHSLQVQTESKKSLPIATALHKDLLPIENKECRRHSLGVEDDKKFVERVQKAFKPETPKEPER